MSLIAKHVWVFSGLIMVVGCTPPPGGSAPQPDRVETVSIESQSASNDIKLRSDISESRSAFEFPASRVWAALPSAYNVLPLPITGIDSAHRFIRGSTLVQREFLRNRLSSFVDCGSTILGQSADSYTVSLRFQSQVDSVSPTSSALRTRIDATGSSGGGSAVRCISSGELERMIREQVKELLGSSP